MKNLTVFYRCVDCGNLGMEDITIFSLDDNIPLQIKCGMQFTRCSNKYCNSKNIRQLRAVHRKDKFNEYEILNKQINQGVFNLNI